MPEHPAEVARDPARMTAPGGWRRVLIGLALGTAVGLALAVAIPRDRARSRRG